MPKTNQMKQNFQELYDTLTILNIEGYKGAVKSGLLQNMFLQTYSAKHQYSKKDEETPFPITASKSNPTREILLTLIIKLRFKIVFAHVQILQ